ncbi:hypothetical protein [Deinococcus metallilatus]|uniref:Uncharacterized protein n=1 Tax=Deinococcus metallilatus TaxID=1211322 RepID=A0ABR6MN91_9DEIO|nr:hypothetical protein [Deinococcus metallilatus]MBB5293398.1 hypothetical protein [Deinococcus metallilatus]GMA15382.1 hypothetical protein GCM10025871_17130 [Deinococcus metallilatus]
MTPPMTVVVRPRLSPDHLLVILLPGRRPPLIDWMLQAVIHTVLVSLVQRVENGGEVA